MRCRLKTIKQIQDNTDIDNIIRCTNYGKWRFFIVEDMLGLFDGKTFYELKDSDYMDYYELKDSENLNYRITSPTGKWMIHKDWIIIKTDIDVIFEEVEECLKNL